MALSIFDVLVFKIYKIKRKDEKMKKEFRKNRRNYANSFGYNYYRVIDTCWDFNKYAGGG